MRIVAKKIRLVRRASGLLTIDPTLTVQPPDKDTYLSQDVPDINYGGEAFLYLYDRSNSRTRRSILEFDISGLPAGVSLASATLSLYYDYGHPDPVGKTVWAYKLTRINWVEAEATWNSYSTGNAWTTAGGDYVTSNPSGGSTTFPASYGWMDWDVLAIVQDAYDASVDAEFLVKYATEGLGSGYSIVYFYSKDYTVDPTLQPKLVIEYSVPAARGCFSKF